MAAHRGSSASIEAAMDQLAGCICTLLTTRLTICAPRPHQVKANLRIPTLANTSVQKALSTSRVASSRCCGHCPRRCRWRCRRKATLSRACSRNHPPQLRERAPLPSRVDITYFKAVSRKQKKEKGKPGEAPSAARSRESSIKCSFWLWDFQIPAGAAAPHNNK